MVQFLRIVTSLISVLAYVPMFYFMLVVEGSRMSCYSTARSSGAVVIHQCFPVITAGLALLFGLVNPHAAKRLWLITGSCIVYAILLVVLFDFLLPNYVYRDANAEWIHHLRDGRRYIVIAVVMVATLVGQWWWGRRRVDEHELLKAGLEDRRS
ncbi:hypothetical protein NG895_14175 [Aeoliella sp. ICT_H6.2]|uniref:Uncharacterized protein n=1 Tax=Aeoliella straminimaris TaxID=2954799 RepID=A0A9X2FBD1_9BACT|nr:hypothetical protein [Aeoliella straminimaris]MCO6045053.1 hypothetical protein [Aeoliella straminimaris]